MFTPRLAVLGAGLMGVGIACHFARHGHAVRLYDTDPQRLAEVPAVASAILCELEASGQQDPADRDAVLARLTPTPTLNALADATLLIEAIPERLALKHALYAELETLIADEAIIASNTSGLPPDQLAQGMRLPERLLIAHFWHPPHLIPLVEVVPGSATLPHLAREVSGFCAACALEAVVLNRAAPGFVGNRLQFALLREALHIVHSGIASPEVVDQVMRASLGRRYAMVGPLEAADMTGLFMEKMVGFVKLYFPVFLLGAVFGKLIELSGFSRSIVAAAIRILGRRHAIPVIVLVCALLTYGGVSLFVVAFAVYPFAAELFRQSGIPKRLIPATVALGAFSFTMDALPGTPQIQNIIPTSFFGTNAWAAPWLGLIGSLFIIIFGLLWLERQRRKAQARGEGYGTDLQNEPETPDDIDLPHPLIAIAPLLLVGVLNLLFTHWIPQWYGASHELNLPGLAKPVVTEVGKITAIWAVQAALLSGIVLVLVCGYRNIRGRLAEGSRTAVGGAILAAMNTASEYGFGAVIAALPGFLVLSKALAAIPNPLLNEAISVTVLAGITGSASGGMSIALAAMSETFVAAAHAANIPLEVLHRVAAMASGGMDTLPHNGAVITLLAITGLSHRQAYGGIFAITVIKSLAVLFVIATFYVTGIV